MKIHTAAAAVLLLLASTLTMTAGGHFPIEPVPARLTTNIPFAMPAVKLPIFADKSVNVLDFGAVRDGHTMNTEAFARAIASCSSAGGGTVIVPEGEYLTGPIRLASGINFHLERGALIVFSRKFSDYPLVPFPTKKSKNYGCTPPIWAVDCENIAITGDGVIDGSGDAWRPVKKEKYTANEWKKIVASGGVVTPDGTMWYPSPEAMNGEAYLKELKKNKKNPTAEEVAGAKEFLRPKMVELLGCSSVLLDGVTFRNSPQFAVHPAQCENMVIRNVTIQNAYSAQNGDGLDISACHAVIVYNAVVDAGDDAICIKPGGYDAGRGWTAACENIIIADCTVYHGHGGFVIGSETYGGARNILARNLTFLGTDVGLRFKSARDRGDLIEKIYVDGIVMKDIVNEAILFDTYYESGSAEKNAMDRDEARKAEPVTGRTPRFDGFTISNVVCRGAGRAVLLLGLPEMPIKNISISNSVFSASKGGLLVDAEKITLDNVTMMPDAGPVYVVKEASAISIVHAIVPKGTASFLAVEGKNSKEITIENTDMSAIRTPVQLGSTVRADAVTVKP
jgi:DNA sulfur modification protein DndE